MMVASIIAYSASALFILGAGLMMFATYRSVRNREAGEVSRKHAELFWHSVIAAFLLAPLGDWLW